MKNAYLTPAKLASLRVDQIQIETFRQPYCSGSLVFQAALAAGRLHPGFNPDVIGENQAHRHRKTAHAEQRDLIEQAAFELRTQITFCFGHGPHPFPDWISRDKFLVW
jgi:hypothetical protein